MGDLKNRVTYTVDPVEPKESNKTARESAATATRVGGGMLPTALRIGTPIAGSVIGLLGTPAASLALGAAGGSLGEYLAQKIENKGTDKGTNWGRVGVEGLIGGVPVVGGSVGKAAIKGGALALAGQAGRKVTSDDPNEGLTKWGLNDALQVGLGTSMGVVAGKLGAGKSGVAPIVKKGPESLEDFLPDAGWDAKKVNFEAAKMESEGSFEAAHALREAARNTNLADERTLDAIIKKNAEKIKLPSTILKAEIAGEKLKTAEARARQVAADRAARAERLAIKKAEADKMADAAVQAKFADKQAKFKAEQEAQTAAEKFIADQNLTKEVPSASIDAATGKAKGTMKRVRPKKADKEGVDLDDVLDDVDPPPADPASGVKPRAAGKGQPAPKAPVPTKVPPTTPFNPPKLVVPEATPTAVDVPPTPTPEAPKPSKATKKPDQYSRKQSDEARIALLPKELQDEVRAVAAEKLKITADTDPVVAAALIARGQAANRAVANFFSEQNKAAKAAAPVQGAVPPVSEAGPSGLRVGPSPKSAEEVLADLKSFNADRAALEASGTPPTPEQLKALNARATALQVEENLPAARRMFAEGSTPIEPPPAGPKSTRKKSTPGSTISAMGLGGGMELLRNNPELAARLGLGLGGAAIGGAVDTEDPLRGAMLGAGAGVVGPMAVKAALNNPDSIKKGFSEVGRLLPSIQRTNLLVDPYRFPINVAASLGAGHVGALERIGTGIAERGLRAVGKDVPITEAMDQGFGSLKEIYKLRPRNVREAWDVAKTRIGEAERGERLIGETVGPADKFLSYVPTWMAAGDETIRAAQSRAGMPEQLSRAITVTANPRTGLGEWATHASKTGGKVGAFLAPFTRTAVNVVESGLERTPGLGIAFQYAIKDPNLRASIAEKVAQQTGGAAAITAGYLIGKHADPEVVKQRRILSLITNMTGQYGLLVSAGFAAGQAAQNGAEWREQVGKGATNATQGLPLPTTSPVNDMLRAAERFSAGEPYKEDAEYLPEQWLPRPLLPAFAKDEVINQIRDTLDPPKAYKNRVNYPKD